MLQEWLARLVALPSVPETMSGMEKLGWFDGAANAFPYLQWKAESQQLVVDPAKTPIPYEQGKTMLQELHQGQCECGRDCPLLPDAAVGGRNAWRERDVSTSYFSFVRAAPMLRRLTRSWMFSAVLHAAC